MTFIYRQDNSRSTIFIVPKGILSGLGDNSTTWSFILTYGLRQRYVSDKLGEKNLILQFWEDF